MKEITKDSQRITKIKPFMNKYNRKGIRFSSEKDDWKKFEKNNVTIAFNVLYAKNKKFKNYLKDKKYCKVRDHCHCIGEYRCAAHSICNLKYSVLKNFL